jgi:hypothetical protein
VNYAEFLRARQTLLIFSVVVLSVVVVDALVSLSARTLPPDVHVHMFYAGRDNGPWPLSMILGIAAAVAAIVAVILGPSLNRYRTTTGELVLTFPVSRSAFALSVLATDALAVLIAIGVVLAGIAIVLANHGTLEYAVIDPLFVPRLFQCTGAALLWFALVQAVSVWLPHRAGYVAGISWPVFLFLFIAGNLNLGLPDWMHSVAHTLNYLNPFAYFQSKFDGDGLRRGIHAFAIPIAQQAVVVWMLALAAGATAVAGWQRAEL